MMIVLDGLTISSEQEFHEKIAIAFSVTNFYGSNLNAYGTYSAPAWSAQ